VSVQRSVYTTKQKRSNTIDVTKNKQFIYRQCRFETTRPARDDNLLCCSTIFQSYFSSKFYIHLLGLPYVRLKAVDSCMSTLYRVGLLQHRCIITMINSEVTLCLLQKKTECRNTSSAICTANIHGANEKLLIGSCNL